MNNNREKAIKDVASEILMAGLRVFLAKSKTYGFYTDEKGTRTVSFQNVYFSVVFTGDYISTHSGQGWIIGNPSDDYSEMLYSKAPHWAIGNDPRWHYQTLAEHLEMFDRSSRYTEIKSFEELEKFYE